MAIIEPPRTGNWPKGGVVVGAFAVIALTSSLFLGGRFIPGQMLRSLRGQNHSGALIPSPVGSEEVAPHTHMVQVATHGINSWEEWYGNLEEFFTTPVPSYPPDQFHAKREVFFLSEGGDRLFSLLFFESEGLPAVREFFDPASGMLQEFVDEGWIIPPMQFKMLNAKAVASVSLEPGSVVASTPSSWPEGVPALTGATVQLNCAVDQATGAYAACSGL